MTNHEQKKALLKEVRLLQDYIYLALQNDTNPKPEWLQRLNDIYFTLYTLRT
jgi:hypothetical protein